MKTSPRTVLDLLLGYISQKYTHYYELPDEQIDGITMVLDVLWKGASRYAIEQQKIPVLVVDGVDLLAKHEELCCRLITLAKVLANDNELKVVLVSSEGTNFHYWKCSSATNARCSIVTCI